MWSIKIREEIEMSVFEKRYGVRENSAVREYHRSRRMFCIYRNQLHIADANLPYSHAVWFTKNGWMSEADDLLMHAIVRGTVDESGDVYFYMGYSFSVREEVEKIFFPHLENLVAVLGLDSEREVFGGMIKSEPGKSWLPQKRYGKIKDVLNSS